MPKQAVKRRSKTKRIPNTLKYRGFRDRSFYSHSIISFWLLLYVVVFLINLPQYLYVLSVLFPFFEKKWVKSWSAK